MKSVIQILATNIDIYSDGPYLGKKFKPLIFEIELSITPSPAIGICKLTHINGPNIDRYITTYYKVLNFL